MSTPLRLDARLEAFLQSMIFFQWNESLASFESEFIGSGLEWRRGVGEGAGPLAAGGLKRGWETKRPR